MVCGFVPQRAAAIKAVLGFLLLAGCAATEPEDPALEAHVQESFRRNPALATDQLRVQVWGHTAYLYGLVDTQLDYFVVEEVAGKVPGIVKVVNLTHMPLNR